MELYDKVACRSSGRVGQRLSVRLIGEFASHITNWASNLDCKKLISYSPSSGGGWPALDQIANEIS